MPSSQPQALYDQLKARLLADIRSGRYGADGKVPTEQELCQEYGLSRTPVARALSELAKEGVVLRQRRRGTFVNPEWMHGPGTQTELRVLATGTVSVDHLRAAAAGEHCRLDVQNLTLDELHPAFLQAIAEGRGPDLAVLDSVWVAEFARFLTPLEELDADGWLAGEYAADVLAPFSYRLSDSTPAVQAPVDVAGLWFRRETFERLAVDPPGTWRELRAIGKRLAEERIGDAHVLVLPGGHRAGEETTYALAGLLASNGALILDPSGAVVLDSPAAVETMRFLRQLVDDGVLSPEVISHDKDQAIELLAHGRAEMCLGGSYQAGHLAKMNDLSLGQVHERFGFVPMPRGPHGRSAVLCGGLVYVIPRQARHPELAMRLLRAAVASEALVRLCLITGQLPPQRSALEAIAEVSPFHAETSAFLDQAVMRPVSPVYALVSAQLQAMLEAVLTRQRGPAAAVSRAADMISAITLTPIG